MARDLRNCPKCGQLFVYTTRNLCKSCRESEEDEFKLVREYIYDNPSATIDEVSKETGVSSKKILRFLREGRLIIDDKNPNLLLDCESCGKPINTGKYCDDCSNKLSSNLKKGFSTGKQDSSLGRHKSRMYTLDRHKKK